MLYLLNTTVIPSEARGIWEATTLLTEHADFLANLNQRVY